jgi:hypothetical protein
MMAFITVSVLLAFFIVLLKATPWQKKTACNMEVRAHVGPFSDVGGSPRFQ